MLKLLNLILLLHLTTCKLIWSDEFDTLNTSRWKHEIMSPGANNGEFQYYVNTSQNTYIKDGKLYILPTYHPQDEQDTLINEITHLNSVNFSSVPARVNSGRLVTSDSFFFKYGRVEIRAKLPRGDWLWPSFWIMPKYSVYGPWPRSGEVDIIESRGNTNMGDHQGIWEVTSCLHWGPTWDQNRYYLSGGKQTRDRSEGDYASRFFNYTFIWNKKLLQVLVDGREILTEVVDKPFFEKGAPWSDPYDNPWEGAGDHAPFDQKFFFILNVAVGGTNGYFPDMPQKPWKNFSPFALYEFFNARSQWLPTWRREDVAFVIDYIRVYDR